MRMSKKIIIPSKFTAHDKINRYGGKIEDPLKINVLNAHEADHRVFTAEVHQKDPNMRVKAIKQIKKTFEDAKSLKVGMVKPGTDGKVTATRVLSLFPNFPAAPTKAILVSNTDISAIEENIPISSFTASKSASQVNQNEQVKKELKAYRKAYNQSNGQIIVPFNEKNEKKLALYRFDYSKPVAKETLSAAYADNKPKAKQLKEAI